MNYIEIIFKDIKICQLDNFFHDFIIFNDIDIISSHFFDKEKKRDLEYKDIKNFKSYFVSSGTCNIYLRKVLIGIELENVIIIISSDKDYCDITINFEEKYFSNCKNIERKFIILLDLILEIYQKYEIEKIIFGYEPAEDADMKILEISQRQVKLFNTNVFNRQWIKAIFGMINKKNI